MGKQADSQIENRVYVFKDLAAAYLQGAAASREDVLQRLGDLAFVSAVVSGESEKTAALLREQITAAAG